MSTSEPNFFRVLGAHKKRPKDGIRDLFASIIMQAWHDARNTDQGFGNRESRKNNTQISRDFLTGNYSRKMFEFYCQALEIDPNVVIKMAMKQKWAKGLQPRYFKHEK